MKFKRLLTALGTLLALIGVAYVIFQLHSLSADQDIFRPKLLAILAAGSVVYALALVLLAQAWKSILAYLGIKPSRAWLYLSYSDYQVAKYVPGNIANILGRQVHAARQGYSMIGVAKSTAMELGGMLVCGGLFWFLLLLKQLGWANQWILVVAGMCIGLCLALLFTLNAAQLALAFLFQLSFLIVSGLVFCGILLLSMDVEQAVAMQDIIQIVATFNAAWIIGVVTPGAPAGVGVRDALLLTWVSALFPSNQTAVAILVSRLSTVAGDAVFWLGVRLYSIAARQAQANK